MNRHATTEQLSAYLDRELGFVELQQLEAHCATCEQCKARLDSMRRVVYKLDNIGRAVPPPALRQQIRRQVTTEAMMPPTGFRAMFERFCLPLLAPQPLLPPQPTLRTAAVMGLALVVGLFVYTHQEPRAVPAPQENVTAGPYLETPISQITTSEVDGRKFILTDSGWIQRGLVGQTPEVQVEASSPQGRALLNRSPDLAILLQDGSPVVLRYNLGTVEIRKNPPTRALSFENEVRVGTVIEV
jgi:Putative zinc-finger